MTGERAGGRATWRSYAARALPIQAALLLAACGGTAEAPVANESTAAPGARQSAAASNVPVTGPKRTVLALGDSLYAGYGLRIGESLPEAIERRLRAGGIDATLVNAGVSGDTSAGGRARLAYTLDRMGRSPDLVLLGLGGNDVLRQIDPAQTRANLDAMLDELERRRIPVVLTGMLAPPNLGPDFAARFNAIFPELAREHDAVLDPFILQGVLGNRRLMLPDGIHPNATGVERIADRVAPLLATRLRVL
ncbi:acyl-CoA thioesterase-1 [Sphingomonas guangdongensis]|uniref:Acyl-CoA thioesterase-1 n=2 Tax=Sphingomonas guangdongensis TaxID=1141890 RepID=A0A285R7G4_9SPHN|nr:acyl-CoA thioesterase-1 [Sphingomonas guangdongensis]